MNTIKFAGVCVIIESALTFYIISFVKRFTMNTCELFSKTKKSISWKRLWLFIVVNNNKS